MNIKDKSKVTSTEFQNRPGVYMDQALKSPVFITKHSRLARVLLDIEDYERLKSLDTREAYWAHEINDDDLEAIKGARMDTKHDHLNEELE